MTVCVVVFGENVHQLTFKKEKNVTSNHFKQIQDQLGFNNNGLAAAINMSVRSVEDMRAGRRPVTERTAQIMKALLRKKLEFDRDVQNPGAPSIPPHLENLSQLERFQYMADQITVCLDKMSDAMSKFVERNKHLI